MLKIFEYGYIDTRLRDKILYTLKNVFSRAGFNPLYIEIYLFENLKELENHLTLEFSEFRRYYSSQINIYFAMHDAYRGWSRIYICIELLNKLPPIVWTGGIVHEAAHAILHGSLEYYLFSLPDTLRSTCIRFGEDLERCFNILYYISIAVKDYEATKYLCKIGFSDDQYPFIKYNLTLEDYEKRLWNLLSDFFSRIEYILMIIKVISAALPLLKIRKYYEEIYTMIDDIVSSLDEKKYKEIVSRIINAFEKLGSDTRENIYNIADTVANTITELGTSS